MYQEEWMFDAYSDRVRTECVIGAWNDADQIYELAFVPLSKPNVAPAVLDTLNGLKLRENEESQEVAVALQAIEETLEKTLDEIVRARIERRRNLLLAAHERTQPRPHIFTATDFEDVRGVCELDWINEEGVDRITATTHTVIIGGTILGPITFHFPVREGRIELPAMAKRDWRGPGDVYARHPHILDYNICWGTYGPLITTLLRELKFPLALQFMIRFVGSFNPRDCYAQLCNIDLYGDHDYVVIKDYPKPEEQEFDGDQDDEDDETEEEDFEDEWGGI